jgi:exosortase/archaeosortase family protein
MELAPTTALPSREEPGSFQQLRDRWRRAPERTQTAFRVVALLGLVVVAYHYSLWTLVQSLPLETPLAYVGLAPLIALLLAGLCARVSRPEVPVYDRQVDYIIGVPLLAVAIVVNTVFRARLSTMFWVWRVDLFSLPFFVAGAVCVLFGVRTVWRQKAAIAFLFLAWPYLYQVVLLRFLNQLTSSTLAGVKASTGLLPVARSMSGSDGSLFQIWHHGRPFQISVASACAGVNGMVGFLLVGAAFAVIVRGPILRKILWLAGGLALLWAVNVGRILFIFWTGRTWGEKVAIDVFHPFIGLVTFSMGVVVMVLALRAFGLTIDGRVLESRPAPSGESAESAGRVKHSHLVAVPKVWRALLLVGLVGVPLAVLNSNLKSFDLVADALGVPRLASFSDYPAVPDGWEAHLADRYDWAKPYFGASSTWMRYTLFPGTSPELRLQSSDAVVADVISTSNLRSFSTYGVEACYRFHGYKLRDLAEVDLGGGVRGRSMSFYNPKLAQDWTVVYWVWPVQTAERTQKPTRFERITLYIQGSGQTSIEAGASSKRVPADPGVKSVGEGLKGADPVTRRLTTVRAFLVEFGRDIVQSQSGVKVGTVLPTPADPTISADARASLLARAKSIRDGQVTATSVVPAIVAPADPAPSGG